MEKMSTDGKPASVRTIILDDTARKKPGKKLW
jgi:hypothetical protein